MGYDKKICLIKTIKSNPNHIIGLLFIETNGNNINCFVQNEDYEITHMFVYNENYYNLIKIRDSEVNFQQYTDNKRLNFIFFNLNKNNKKIIGYCSTINESFDKLFFIKCFKQYKLKQRERKNIKNAALSYFEKRKSIIEKIMSSGKDDTVLMSIYNNSVWKRVVVKDSCYVLGLIFNTSEVKIIAVGKPVFKKYPKPELNDVFDEFIAVSDNNPEGFGYWITFRDAKTGKKTNV